jgi:hypothetical protein
VIISRRLYKTTGRTLICLITDSTRIRPVIFVELFHYIARAEGKVKVIGFFFSTWKIIVIWNVTPRVYVDEYKFTQRRYLDE